MLYNTIPAIYSSSEVLAQPYKVSVLLPVLNSCGDWKKYIKSSFNSLCFDFYTRSRLTIMASSDECGEELKVLLYLNIAWNIAYELTEISIGTSSHCQDFLTDREIIDK